MIDVSTKKPLHVSGGGDVNPWLILPVEQLDSVRSLLDKHAFDYWVDEFAISVDGRPKVTFINFAIVTDPRQVQQILDEAY